MYNFKTETDLEKFENFVLSHGGIYMQSAKWAKVKTAWKSYFYSGFDQNGEMVLSCLILERKLPVGKIWYSPAGAVCDYCNSTLLKEFSAFIKREVKRNGAFVLFFDPCVELRVNGEYRENGKKVHNTLIEAGYTLNPNASKCLYKAPVQLITLLKDKNGNPYTPEKLLKSFEKGVRYSVRIGEQRALHEEIFTIDDVNNNPLILEGFKRVMSDTSERNDFLERDTDYVKHLMEVFGNEGMDIMLVFYDKSRDMELEKERQKQKKQLLEALTSAPEKKIKGIKEEIDSIDRQTEHFLERMKETENEKESKICVAGGLTVHYGNMSSCLFGGARNLLRNNLRSSHFFNYKRLCRSIALGNTYHDLGYVLLKDVPPTKEGYLGECVPNEDFEGICSFKKSFNADYIEYIGEYILVADKAKYYMYESLLGAAKKAQSVVNKAVKKRRQ